jgi:predicted NAD/FAD-binding protein
MSDVTLHSGGPAPAIAPGRTVAVIGSGISGLAAAYLISRRHQVTLFERDRRLGGHTHTVVVEDEQGPLPLDTGFLVHNDRTYPNLVRLFAELGVRTRPSDMSFSVACPTTGYEYSSRGLRGFFAQPRHIVSATQYVLLREIVRFNREAPAVLGEAGAEAWTLGEYLERHRYGHAFVTRYLVPMTSAIWSTSFEGISAFPVQTLVRFMQNHGMLSVAAHPLWRVVDGGSHTYIPRLIAPLDGRVERGVQLRGVGRDGAGVTLHFADRPAARFDHVVFACHGDQVLPLLQQPTDAERGVFREFTTTRNVTWLHRDGRLLPAAPWARASWNYRIGGDADAAPSVTYHLNRLQGLSTRHDYCVTLNPRQELADGLVIRTIEYRHPRYTVGAVRAQSRWREVSGGGRTHFCGAYWRYGFHEDGLLSAIRVAADFGVRW